MNEAWAALIAGIAAAIGGALGGLIAARAAVKQSLTEGREQQRNWLLDQRLDAYTELLAAYDVVRERLKLLVEAQANPFVDDGEGFSAEVGHAVSRLHESREELARALQRIDLVGPRSVMQPAVDGVTQAVDDVFRTRVSYNANNHTEGERQDWLAAREAFNLAQIIFVDRANEVLHSDEL